MRYAIPSLIGTLLLGTLVATPPATAAEPGAPLSAAFSTIFSPQKAPEKKSMGLLQRNFLDLVETSQDKLQVALVIDGTDSMAADMDGVRASMNAMITDLRRYKGEQVEFCVVVYRDSGSTSGEVSMLLNQFTSDEAALTAAIAKLKPESGAPYFAELADLGVHEAITKLAWDKDELTTRWIMLVGDAPPYKPDFAEGDVNARRRYDTDLLVSAARRNNININCILCTSDGKQEAAYQESLPQTRNFMSVLSSQTGGLMLDLSYPDIRQALIENNLGQRVEVTEIGTITPDDVTAARQTPPSIETALDLRDGKRVSIAVLPILSQDKLTFAPDQAAVQNAAEARYKLRMIPQVEVRSPVDVERHARRLQRQGLTDTQFAQALAVRLRVDYIWWGKHHQDGQQNLITTDLLSRETGESVASVTQPVPAITAVVQANQPTETTLVGSTLQRLVITNVSNQSGGPPTAMNASFRSFTQDPNAMKALGAPIAGKSGVRKNLLHGMETLEKSLALPPRDPQSDALLTDSANMLEKVVAEEARNPLAQALLWSCYYNQGQAAQKRGDKEAAAIAFKKAGNAVKRAYSFRADATEDFQQEIEADYALLIKGNAAEAIPLYTKLASGDTTRTHALRANWMLAGIYTNDWNVGEEYLDRAKAREHLIQILAHWPESPEADFIRKNLRWDNKSGTKYKYMPKENDDLLTAMK